MIFKMVSRCNSSLDLGRIGSTAVNMHHHTVAHHGAGRRYEQVQGELAYNIMYGELRV